MDVLQIFQKILSQFSKLDLPPSILDQVSNARISFIEESPSGAFADLECASEAIFTNDSEGDDVSVIRTLVSQDEVADVILHLQNGKIVYLEISLYSPSAGWGQLDSAVLK